MRPQCRPASPVSARSDMEYREEDFLSLSGLQHFSFCRRQWALIHIEQQWQENLRTVEGALLHQKAHGPFVTEKRGDLLISRGMPVFSRSLGVNGVCDVVELRAAPDGVPIAGRDGRYLPMAVEYKRGSPKEDDCDRLQVCCQSLCLEEMFGCEISEAALYYGETGRRTRVPLGEDLRCRVREVLAEMHTLFSRRYTPKVKPAKHCNACSLKELCLPKLYRKSSVQPYLQRYL